MAVHKIFIFAQYDEQEYDYYLDAYLTESAETIGSYCINEISDLLDKIRSGLADDGAEDTVDLYLAQTDVRDFWEYEKDLKEAGMTLSRKTSWTDDEAYEVLRELLRYQPEIVLHGKDTVTGSQADTAVSVYCTYCAQADAAKKENLNTENLETVKKETKPPLAVLMRQLAEGTDGVQKETAEGAQKEQPEKENTGPSLAALMRQLAEGGRLE